MRLLLVLFAIVAVNATKFRYDGYQVFEVGPLQTEAKAKVLDGLIDKDQRLKQIILFPDSITLNVPVAVAVAPKVVHRFLEVLHQNLISFELVDADIQKTFDKNFELNELALAKYGPEIPVQFEHDAYLRFAQQQQYLRDLSAANSGFTRTFSIGNSYEGRELTLFTINEATSRPAIWIDCNIHAREWITSATCLYIIDQIVTGTSTDAVYLRNNFRWYFLPNVNPDGYEYSHTNDRMWRKTRAPNAGSVCDGTDGNRNWDSNWGGEGSSPNECSDTYHGTAPFSADETAAQSSYMRTISSISNLCISIHSYSQLWLVPWGGYNIKPADYPELLRVGNLAADAIQNTNGRSFQVGTPPDILYVAAGGTFDWAKESNGMAYSYSPELRPATELEGGFDVPPTHIIPSGEEIFAAVVVTAREHTPKI